MDLFTQSARKRQVGQPLAERMRPRLVDELVGQAHLLAPGKILSSLVPGRAIPSLILWGPPGSGKTTLARLLGEALRSELVALSAVTAGVKDVREAVAKAAERRDQLVRARCCSSTRSIGSRRRSKMRSCRMSRPARSR